MANESNPQPKHLKPNPWVDPKPVEPCPESPLISLIDKPMEDMTDDELREHAQALRASAANGKTFQKQIRQPKKKKETTKKKHVVDVDKYLNMEF